MADTSPLPDEESPVSEEIISSWAILILISLLFATLFTSYYLQRRKIKFIHETVVSIFLGLFVGLVIRLLPTPDLQRMVSFDHRYFFNLLLPPIILNSGYDMKRKNFFRNFGSILTFAILGTIISTFIIAFAIYLGISAGLENLKGTMSFLDCMIFGAILSSTDPVTVLAIFHQNRVDPKLYSIIFGESLLNDSVAIVLFSTLGQFRGKEVTFLSVLGGIFTFCSVFTGSVIIGVIIGLIGALMLKHSHLHQYPSLESCLIALLAYSSYLLSNGIQLSGIVSLLFCGITLKHYAYDNMSLRSRRTTKYMFRVLSQLSENFIFIYLGVTLFTREGEVYLPFLIFYTLIIILIARYLSVIPLAEIINWINVRLYHRDTVIPKNHQLMLFWASLRGAIAFALSFEVSGKAAEPIRTTTLMVCVITIILLGGTTNYALVNLKIRTGVGAKDPLLSRHGNDDEETDSSEDEDEEYDNGDVRRDRLGSENMLTQPFGPFGRYRDSFDESDFDTPDDDGMDGTEEEQSSEGLAMHNVRQSLTLSRLGRFLSPRNDDTTHWFIGFDDRWLKPMFTNPRPRRKFVTGRSKNASPINRQTLFRSEGNVSVPRASGGSGRAFGKLQNVGTGTVYGGGAGSSSSTSPPKKVETEAKKATTLKTEVSNEEFKDFRGNVWTQQSRKSISSGRGSSSEQRGESSSGKVDIIELGT
ncbi:monovalent cation:H+ antiporter, CPA1 (nhx1) [Nowakowskiella sp. JEL0407]|nr:monovalent cation:H+ antiporter, CPA1 (nhx1) [Nowakowskiella sp. JEL0407]